MMIRTTAVFVLMLAHASPAAAWSFETDTDAMTDKVTATITETNKLGASLTVKCWEGQERPTLIFTLGERFDASANYALVVDAQMRIDKNEVMDLQMEPQNVGGYLVLLGAWESPEKDKVLLDQLSRATEKIGFQMGNMSLKFGVSRTVAVVKKLVAACKLFPAK